MSAEESLTPISKLSLFEDLRRIEARLEAVGDSLPLITGTLEADAAAGLARTAQQELGTVLEELKKVEIELHPATARPLE